MNLWPRALAAWQHNDHGEAKSLLEQILTFAPSDVQARHLYGIVSTEVGSFVEAVEHLEFVCQAMPESEEALSDLARAQHLAGRLLDAEATLRSGIASNPDSPNLHFNLGLILKAAQRPGEAEAEFLRATELDPVDQGFWFQLGLQRFSGSDHLKAASAFMRAAQINGEHKQAATRMAGFALADGGRPEQAAPLLASLCPERAEETEDFHLLSQLIYCRLELCDWYRVSEMVGRCKQFIAEGKAPLEPFTFLLLPEITAKEQLGLAGKFAERLIADSNISCSVIEDRDPARRLRIGYLSSDFHDHAVMRLLAGVLEHHKHSEFEIHAFSYGGPDQGEMRRRAIAACDFFHDVTALAPEALARHIREKSIDILIDLTGWSGNTRSATLAFRPSPIQVNWLGYSATLGSRILADYLIGDPVSTPLVAIENFAEELMLLPNCCHPADASRPIGHSGTRTDEGLPEDGFVFCCFSRPLKITPAIFRCWCDLLLRTPGSVLWLLAWHDVARENLCFEAERHGIDRSRLIFSPGRAPEEHLARLSLADLALDTFPFGAHTTASDALWAGLPVITIMGETLASRVTGSMLKAVGLGELATRSIDEYLGLALELAANRNLLQSIRNSLKINRCSSALFDTKEFAAALEAVFREMWRRKCRDV